MPARTFLHTSLWGSEPVVSLHSIHRCNWSNSPWRKGLLSHFCIICCDRLSEFTCNGWLMHKLWILLLLLITAAGILADRSTHSRLGRLGVIVQYLGALVFVFLLGLGLDYSLGRQLGLIRGVANKGWFWDFCLLW